MYKGITFSASLMCIDWINVGKQLVDLEENNIDYVHYDIIDGNFAPDFTMGSSIVNLIQQNTNIKSEGLIMNIEGIANDHMDGFEWETSTSDINNDINNDVNNDVNNEIDVTDI